MPTIVLDDAVTGRRHAVELRRLFVAGFTGRDRAAIDEHLRELAELGVPTPDRLPTLYEVDPDQLRQTPELLVAGAATSGEAEPVLVVHGGERLLTIGSDHTDRDVERVDIAASKRATGKVVGTTCVPLDHVAGRWDDVELVSVVDGGTTTYQQGTLGALLPVEELLDRLRADHGLELADGDALFLGTIAAIGGVRPSATFEAALRIPGGPALSVAYRVTDVGAIGRVPFRKPELEFTAVEAVDWVPAVPGVAGQWERILAADPATGVRSRILRFDPGVDTSTLGVLRHDFWEEVYILSGWLDDLTLGQRFEAGTYACRPPGMPHGPWRTDAGCTTFEVRYPAV